MLSADAARSPRSRSRDGCGHAARRRPNARNEARRHSLLWRLGPSGGRSRCGRSPRRRNRFGTSSRIRPFTLRTSRSCCGSIRPSTSWMSPFVVSIVPPRLVSIRQRPCCVGDVDLTRDSAQIKVSVGRSGDQRAAQGELDAHVDVGVTVEHVLEPRHGIARTVVPGPRGARCATDLRGRPHGRRSVRDRHAARAYARRGETRESSRRRQMMSP